jgi:cell wall-associated NlpC family hydrolase
VKVKDSGYGAAPIENPFTAYMLPTFEAPEEYDKIGEAPEPVEPIEIPTAPKPSSKGLLGSAGAWGGYANGLIPVSALAEISFARGQVAEKNAAAAFEAMNAAYKAETGRNIGVTDSYRSLSGQQAVARKKPKLAAKPGTSNHGWGKAFDLNVRGDKQLKAWLDANAARFGFVNPDWAKKSSRFEPWHWEYTGGGAQPAARRPKPASPNAEKVIRKAKEYVGTPYKWGGASPLGFDQSGFTQFVYRTVGVNLPRISYQQATYGRRIPIDDLSPGDLVAWDSSPQTNGADHVALFIGNGQVIHAPRPGERVKISHLWDIERAWGIQMNL